MAGDGVGAGGGRADIRGGRAGVASRLLYIEHVFDVNVWVQHFCDTRNRAPTGGRRVAPARGSRTDDHNGVRYGTISS